MKSLLIGTTAFLALAALYASVNPNFAHPPWRSSHFENVLGTSMEIKLLATTDAAAENAEAAALAEIKRLDGILSGYNPASEFSHWAATQGEAVPVSQDLMEVLALWDSWCARTGGALNPAAEAVGRVWKNAETIGRLPTTQEKAAAAQAAQTQHWSLDRVRGTAIRLDTVPLKLNSFTKSYIVEQAAQAALQTVGITGVVVNIGGDLVVRGTGREKVSVSNPRSDAENSKPIAAISVADHAVATSGSYRRGFNIQGQHFSHIVDPRTGNTAEAIIGATVVSNNASDAGALATALCVLSPEESRKLAALVPGSEYMLMEKNGAVHFSSGWASLQVPRPFMMLAAAAPQTSGKPSKESGVWNPAYELTLSVEIPQAQGFGARRPYVAVWIEDKDRFPVRTLAVLYEKARWLNELRAWYRDDRLRAMSEGTEILNSVTSATRSPGKYSFKWDGKDNSGKPVKEGTYTVLAEAAREHGGYNVVRRELSFNGEPAQAQVPPAGELGTVTIDYHKANR